jgi:hypothetical protein
VTVGRCALVLASRFKVVGMASAEPQQSSFDLLGRHAHRTAILRKVWRLRLFLVGYFLKMFATLLPAVERRISPERRAVINHDTTFRALPHDGDIHASDKRSVVVKEINVRPSGALRD